MSSTLPRLLDDTRKAHPDRVAVEDARSGTSLTYDELGERAAVVRDSLKRRGVVPGDRVGVCAPKSPMVVAALHGILSVRAAYVPVDPFAPASRNAGILKDCGVRAIIAGEAQLASFSATLAPVKLTVVESLAEDLLLVTSDFEQSVRDESTRIDTEEILPTDLAYILYTSGSTGRPKGVMHTHASAVSFVEWSSRTFSPQPDDRFSSIAPFHFDLSILDLFVSMKHGAAVVLIDDETAKQPLRLAPIIAERAITICYATPSTLRLLAGFGRPSRHDYSALRLVLFAGEVFPPTRLDELKAVWPHPRYFNLYGPTETNVCTYFEIPAEPDPSRITPWPIGHACDNDRTRVINADGSDTTPGDDGELCVTGGSVMKGYWNQRDRTRDSFLVDGAGDRWYRTGDIVRESADDGYTFIGRRDRMVKRRGFRVELAEVEAALNGHPAIDAAAVSAFPDEESGVRLEAALVASPAGRPSIIELKQFCAGNLPLYMVPDRFRFLESLPQTSTGKVDYQRLQDEMR